MRIFIYFSFICFFFSMPFAYAQCANPVGSGGDIVYNLDHTVMQYCNDTDWISMGATSSDNLGDHTATQTLDMSGSQIDNVANPTSAQDAATKFYVDSLTGANETDPQVGTLTSSKWCTTNGTSINCTSNTPILSEVDPKVSSVSNNQWCRGNGSAVTCDQSPPVLTEVDPQVGTLTSTKWCTTDGTAINCTSNAPGGGVSSIDDLSDVDTTGKSLNDVLTWDGTNWIDQPISIAESDPQVGTLTNTKWCTTNGTSINCTSDAPSGGGTPKMISFNSTSIYRVPAGVSSVDVTLVGGAGAGGGGGGFLKGGGGGGGGWRTGILAVTPGQIITCTVGSGSKTTSGDGGNSTFLGMTAKGGKGGGAGGGGSGGDSGGNGSSGNNGTNIIGGKGGGVFGGSGGPGSPGASGGNGQIYGGGGGGGIPKCLTEYYSQQYQPVVIP